MNYRQVLNEVEVTLGIFKSLMLSRRHVANVQKVFNEIEGTSQTIERF